MNKNLKKIIAREGLILLSFGVVLFIGFLVLQINQLGELGSNLLIIGFLGYPVYLLIRFIIWAIKTLREK